MRISPTLSGYVARQFMVRLAAMFLGVLLIVFLLDLVEHLRRAAGHEDVPFSAMVVLVLLRLPQMAQMVLPFVVLFASMLTFWKLTRTHELVVMRAAGVSVWQFLAPVLIVAIAVGIFKTTVFNPFAAASLSRYEQLSNRYLRGQDSLMSVSAAGVWLRQADPDGQSVVHAERVGQDAMSLSRVIVFSFRDGDHFVRRIDAETAELEPGAWALTNAWVTEAGMPARFQRRYTLPTDLTVDKILNSFSSPETLSFWALPGFIQVLEQAGFSSVRHRLHWHAQLTTPLLLSAMAIIAAAFSLRHTRRGGTTAMILAGALVGFIFYFLSDVTLALGLSNSLPPPLAAWSPAAIALLLGLSMLIHLEDG